MYYCADVLGAHLFSLTDEIVFGLNAREIPYMIANCFLCSTKLSYIMIAEVVYISKSGFQIKPQLRPYLLISSS